MKINFLEEFAFNLDILPLLILEALFVIFIAISLIIYFNERKRSIEIGLNRFKSNRLFMVNMNDHTVEYLDFKDLQTIKVISQLDFLKFFTDNEQNNIKTFINRAYNLEFPVGSEEAVLPCNLIITRSTRTSIYRGIIKVNAVDKVKGVVYLEVERLINTPFIKTKRSKKDVYDISFIRKTFDDGKFNKGSFGLIKLYYRPETLFNFNENIFKRIIVDYVYKVTSNTNTYFYFSARNKEIAFFDTRLFPDYQFNQFLTQIRNSVAKAIEIEGLINGFDFVVCGGRCQDLPRSYEEAYLKMNILANSTHNINKDFAVYRIDTDDEKTTEHIYKNEINRLIEEKDFYTMFRPIIRVGTSRIHHSGYIAKTFVNSNIFKTQEDIVKFAKQYGRINDYASLFAKKTIPMYIMQCENLKTLKLSFAYSLQDLENLINVIEKINRHEEVKIIFVVNNYEVLDMENSNDFAVLANRIKKIGYGLGLRVAKNSYYLKDETYKLFDAFYLDFDFEKTLGNNSRVFIKEHDFIKKLSSYNKPLIAYRIQTVKYLDELTKLGVKEFSGTDIAKFEKMVIPLDRKEVQKIVDKVIK